MLVVSINQYPNGEYMARKSKGDSSKAKKPFYKRIWFIAIAAIFVIAVINSAMGGESSTETPTASDTNVAESTQTEESTSSEEAAEAPNETTGQANARKSAKNYLSTLAFSRSGLIKQLEFEGYSTEDATYGTDAQNADWNEQAVKAAKNYLDTMAFSREGLIQQLEFEGFSTAEAEFGANGNGY
jgi:hypothetical protein